MVLVHVVTLSILSVPLVTGSAKAVLPIDAPGTLLSKQLVSCADASVLPQGMKVSTFSFRFFVLLLNDLE